MPTYDYQCPQCKLRFEVKRAFSDNDSQVLCTSCGTEAKRLFSAVPIIFKGPGFYITDSRAESKEPGETKKGTEKEKEIGKETGTGKETETEKGKDKDKDK